MHAVSKKAAPAWRRGSTATGVLLMIVAMLVIPAADGFAKHLSQFYSPMFISWARYAAAVLFVVPVVAMIHRGKVFPSEQLGAHTLRTLLLVTAMSLYYVAIVDTPLATAISAFLVGPIVAVVLSVLFFGERMTVLKAVSLILGFVGSLVVLRPDTAIRPGLLLAFGSGICFAIYMIATRRAAQGSDPVKTLAFQCVVGALLLVPQALFTWAVPEVRHLWMFLAMGAISALSHGLSITAFRLAEATTLAPLVYLELVGAIIIGYLVFGDLPGVSTAIGAGMIVLGGLLLLRR